MSDAKKYSEPAIKNMGFHFNKLTWASPDPNKALDLKSNKPIR